jgi:hypothetical protein
MVLAAGEAVIGKGSATKVRPVVYST